MTQLLKQFSLTQYTEFRQLELEYFKVKDQNEVLRTQLRDLQGLYQRAVIAANQSRKEAQMLRAELATKSKQNSAQKIQLESQLHQISQTLTSLFPNNHQKSPIIPSQPQKQPHLFIKTYLEQLSTQFHKLNMTVKQMHQQSQHKQQKWQQKQQQFSSEIAQLQIDLQTLEKLQLELQNENEKIVRENQELQGQVRSYKTMVIEARNYRREVKTLEDQLETEFNEEDKDFAADLLGYQKELLSRVFGLVIESFEKDDIEICLRKIYEAYEDVTQCYREKLQIQYDLSDLECQYQKRKSTNSKQIVVELRKQINNFRKQLFNQKELLHKRQEILQERIKDLSGQAIHDNRLKNFTIGLQTKFRKQRSVTQENDDRIIGDLSKVGTIEFRPNMETDEIVKQMIQKDRENLEKMLKETRNQFRR